MRIAHISDCFLPRLGGIEVQVAELARHQAEAGHEVLVATATRAAPGTGGNREHLDGVRIVRTVARLPFDLPVHPRTGHVLRPVLRDFRPDVVHVHLGVVSPYAWGGVRAALDLGVPMVVTVHCVWGGASQTAYRALDRAGGFSRGPMVFGAVSDLVAERIRAALGPSARVVPTPNGVDSRDWNPGGRLIRGTRPVQFVAAMRLAPRKRAVPLVDMFGRALQLSGDPNGGVLSIAGDGPERERVAEHIRSAGLHGRVLLLGRLSRPELKQQYLRSDVFIQPSVMESFGLAALEARATGLPVVARDTSGLTDFIHEGVEGLLAHDDQEMAAAISRLITDSRLRTEITEHNTGTAPQHLWPSVLGTIDQAYAAAIGQ